MYRSVRWDEEGGGGEERIPWHTFFHTAVGSLGATPSINISAKETCFQGAFLFNGGYKMRGMVSFRGSRRRVDAGLQLSHVVQVFEEHLHGDMMMLWKSKNIMALLRPCGFR